MNPADAISFGLLCAMTALQVFLASWLWLRPMPRKDADALLAIFFVANAPATALESSVLLFPMAVGWLTGIRLPLLFVLGPALYLYTKALTHSTPQRWSQHVGAHVLVPVIAVLTMIPFYLIDDVDKNLLLSGQRIKVTGTVGWGAISLIANLLVFPIVLGAYLVASLRLLRRHLVHIRDFFSSLRDRNLSWLRWTLMAIAAAWLYDTLDTISGFFFHRTLLGDGLDNLLELAWIYVLGLLALRQAPIFASVMPASAPNDLFVPGTPAERKYARSALTDTDLDRIAAKLQAAMPAQQLHRNPELTLRDLGDAIDVAENYLSQTLNARIGKSFYDYVNGWRIDEACARLRDSDESVLRIAEDAGFNSRSTFNSAFRKATGTTPSAYRERKRAMAEPVRSARSP